MTPEQLNQQISTWTIAEEYWEKIGESELARACAKNRLIYQQLKDEKDTTSDLEQR